MDKVTSQRFIYVLVVIICITAGLQKVISFTSRSEPVVFCFTIFAILFMGLLYFGLFQTTRRSLSGMIKSKLAFLLTYILYLGLGLPFGLLGFSSIIEDSLPLSGSQFTWLTINRRPLVFILGGLELIGIGVAIYLRGYLKALFTQNSDHPIKVLKLTFHKGSAKDLLKWSLFGLLLMIVVTGMIIEVAWLNSMINNHIVFFVSAGILTFSLALIEILFICRLLEIRVINFKPSFTLFVLAFISLVLMCFFNGQVSSYQATKPMNQTIIIHRGVINHNSQANTISALKKNSRYHFPYVEMDIQETMDHHFICAHDDVVKIPGKGFRDINDLRLATIEKYHHVEVFGNYLRVANRLRQPLIIELKVTNNSDPKMGDQFINQFRSELIKQHHQVHSIGYRYLQQIKRREPQIRVGLVTMLNFSDLNRYQVNFYTLQHITLNARVINAIHKTNRPIYAWTDDHQLSMKRMWLMGVNGQVTDQAVKLKQLSLKPQRDEWVLILNLLVDYL